MEGAIWTALGLPAATSLGTLFSLGSRIDAVGSRMDALSARMDTPSMPSMPGWMR